jgi:hypothetical protein
MRWTELIELGASFNQLPSHLKNQLLFEELMEVRMLFDQLPHRLKNELSFAEFTQKYLIFQKTGHLTPHRDESSFLLDSKPLNKQEEYDDD